MLPDGHAAWIDGGPRGPIAASDLDEPVVHAESVELGRLTPSTTAGAGDRGLAPDQLATVAHGAGPARIVAPAGSGRTRVLTEQRHLVVDRGIERETALAVAYNKKAQLELEARTTDFGPRISTLNALGYRLLARLPGRGSARAEQGRPPAGRRPRLRVAGLREPRTASRRTSKG